VKIYDAINKTQSHHRWPPWHGGGA